MNKLISLVIGLAMLAGCSDSYKTEDGTIVLRPKDKFGAHLFAPNTSFVYSSTGTCAMQLNNGSDIELVSEGICANLMIQEQKRNEEKRLRSIVEEEMFKSSLRNTPQTYSVDPGGTIDVGPTITILDPCDVGQFAGCPEKKKNGR